MNVLKELIHSIYDLKSYPVFMKDKNRKTFLFGVLLVFVYFLLTVMVPYAKFQVSTGGLVHMMDEVVPDFTIRNQSVTVEDVVEYEEDGILIYVNTDEVLLSEEELQDFIYGYRSVLLVDKEKVIILNNGQLTNIPYSELDPTLSLTKAELVELVGPYITVFTVIVLVLIFLGKGILFFVGVLLVALLGMIVASCKHHTMTYEELYKLGIYTRTTPLLIKGLLSLVSLEIPFFFIINMGISVAYLAGAIGHMQAPPLEGAPLEFSSGQTGPLNQQADEQGFSPEQEASGERKVDEYGFLVDDEDRWK